MQNKEQFSSPENFQKYLQSINKTAVEQQVDEPKENIVEDNVVAPEKEHQEEQAVSDQKNEALEEQEEVIPENSHYIPKSRLNKEIEKRRAIEMELSSYKENQSKLQSQLEELNQMMRQQQEHQTTSQVPEYSNEESVDPLDTETHNFYMKKIKQLEDKITSLDNESHQNVEDLQRYNALNYQESIFNKIHPDYNDALKHLVDTETRIAEQIVSANDAKKLAKNKISQIVNYALSNNKNVPEVMYNMAKQYGYKTQEKKAKTSNIDNITKNLDKSANINEINANMPLSGSGGLDITYALNDPKSKRSGVDPDKFHEILARIKK